MSSELENALSAIPDGLRKPLLREYVEALEAAKTSKWETVGLKAGKLCEIIYTILHGHTSGTFSSKPSKLGNMFDACQGLAHSGSTFPRSVRLQMPRVICAVYELRNNRDIGHVGADVDPNKSDGEFFLQSIKWMIAELVRIFYAVDVDVAAKIVASVTAKSNPTIWSKGNVTRVLDAGLSAKDKTLIILYHAAEAMDEGLLRDNVEYKNPTDFRRVVLKLLHQRKLIEYDMKNKTVEILPPGIQMVEGSLLK